MSKLLPGILVAFALLLGQTEPHKQAIAGTCAAGPSVTPKGGSNCGPQPVQFVPGQRITVEIANFTSSIVELQNVPDTDPVPVNPGQVRSFIRGGSTEPNFSLVMWDANGLPVRANILKPEARTLRIEIRPGGRPPGDRTVYLKDDGRVAVF